MIVLAIDRKNLLAVDISNDTVETLQAEVHRFVWADLQKISHSPRQSQLRRLLPQGRWIAFCLVVGIFVSCQLLAREKDTTAYGEGLIVNVPYPESEVSQIVEDIVQNGIIRGTKEYNKDEYVSGATPASSTKVFPAWTEGGKVFYKIRFKALDPRNFKNSSDVGTLAVRYIVQPQGSAHTVLRIDAIFVEDFRHTSHLSNGSVEGAEYKDIHDHLEQLELLKGQPPPSEDGARGQVSRSQPALTDESPKPTAPQPTVPVSSTEVVASTGAPPPDPPKPLDEQVHDLKRQVQRMVKAPGAPLKSAPFHTAATLTSLSAGTEVLIVISTPYWLGVETHEGQHGWMLRDDLELVP